MFHLAPFLLEKVGIIFMAAYILSQMRPIRQIVQHEHNRREKVMLTILFGSFGIISNYTGIEIDHNYVAPSEWLLKLDRESALANTRVMGIAIGGLLGGPMVGFGAGVMAGVHRFSLGGFTALSCGISTIFAGIAAGYLGKVRKRKGKKITASFAAVTGMTLETVQMLIILIAAKPFSLALNLVQIIGLPMILVNGLGTLLFMFIFQSILKENVRTQASSTNLAFKIADLTLPFFREGFHSQSCKEIAKIILKLTAADAVSITDTHQVLAHVGVASEHHITGSKPVTGLTEKVLTYGKIIVANNKAEIHCSEPGCPLEAAIVLPLMIKNEVVGTLKMYYTDPDKLDQLQQELAEGLAKLFSEQLELSEAYRQTKLLKDAEIKALQAQIHPHFLFNSLNTISSLCRTNPDKARKLLLQLSSFFRSNLQGARQTHVSLEKELENVNAYLSIVQTRFPGKYSVDFQIEPHLENTLLPPFILQPLVENAINYAFPKSKDKGEITIRIFLKRQQLQIIVSDNGKGIEKDQLKQLGTKIIPSKKGSGSALYNINQRLKGLYSGQASLSIDSKENDGTTITISMPFDSKGVIQGNVEGLYSGR
ncbi:sensor histidine kinase [Bacillus benzoevorans]|uniref:histidine kinase n=1 Tax=Bacillus benzoevorans TaxID=1456 RepID=A0A7X0HNW1_9BACI|nr:sensor histidine kinase [Bacillus benzoevorans]MBB6444248.1 two-component system sensor histidine kinase LytS [Bacillus benzoevorans]